ncbi:hypothetical protein [Clostridium algidicarnis]|uniref:hypothetical protein n=1 Tax=Clostridium algidicarnis TaxID=37659 RepID=UPI001C0BEEFA|nr:hypothetical protein [Clostridium algidicarnis]MBU3202630.1 hypothetical protein [Clostridium algidicarnis]MBU3210784.1 hypothetical protein [Clostridium algidicarnis]MBU3222708.1 hypothetical protein [Clostridium algidicarnis]
MSKSKCKCYKECRCRGNVSSNCGNIGGNNCGNNCGNSCGSICGSRGLNICTLLPFLLILGETGLINNNRIYTLILLFWCCCGGNMGKTLCC